MPCLVHPAEPDVGVCTRCGRAVCEQCLATPHSKPPICNVCLPQMAIEPVRLARPLAILALFTGALVLGAVAAVWVLGSRRQAAPLLALAIVALLLALGIGLVRYLRRAGQPAAPRLHPREWADEFGGPVLEQPRDLAHRLKVIVLGPESLIVVAVLLLVFVLPVLLPAWGDRLRGLGEFAWDHIEVLAIATGVVVLGAPEGLAGLARLYLARGEYGRAQAVIRFGLRYKPRSMELLTTQVDAALGQGRLAEAEVAARRLVRAAPTTAASYATLAGVLAELGQHREAEAACRRAIALQSFLPAAYNNLAWALAVRGEQLERAALLPELGLRVSRSNADRAACLGTLSRVYLRMGRVSEAVDKGQEAVRLAGTVDRPLRARLLYGLGLAQRAAGQVDHAAGSLRRAAALDPRGRYAEPARRTLWEMGHGLKEE